MLPCKDWSVHQRCLRAGKCLFLDIVCIFSLGRFRIVYTGASNSPSPRILSQANKLVFTITGFHSQESLTDFSLVQLIQVRIQSVRLLQACCSATTGKVSKQRRFEDMGKFGHWCIIMKTCSLINRFHLRAWSTPANTGVGLISKRNLKETPGKSWEVLVKSQGSD